MFHFRTKSGHHPPYLSRDVFAARQIGGIEPGVVQLLSSRARRPLREDARPLRPTLPCTAESSRSNDLRARHIAEQRPDRRTPTLFRTGHLDQRLSPVSLKDTIAYMGEEARRQHSIIVAAGCGSWNRPQIRPGPQKIVGLGHDDP